jgi:hypothetical protein
MNQFEEHDHYTVMSRDGTRHHTRLVVAADSIDALMTHHEHYPGCEVSAVLPRRCL